MDPPNFVEKRFERNIAAGKKSPAFLSYGTCPPRVNKEKPVFWPGERGILSTGHSQAAADNSSKAAALTRFLLFLYDEAD
jgi:hypothetical protein